MNFKMIIGILLVGKKKKYKGPASDTVSCDANFMSLKSTDILASVIMRNRNGNRAIKRRPLCESTEST